MTKKETAREALPEGATAIDLERPFGKSVDLAIEIAERGASDKAVKALGGDEALDIVRENREKLAEEQRGLAQGNGDQAPENGAPPSVPSSDERA